MSPAPKSPSTAGFTLVEIALALLVLAIGMVTLLGLFPAALSVNKGSIDETRAAIFAEEVMNAIKASAAETPWAQINTREIIAPGANTWKSPNSLRIRPNTNSFEVNRYVRERAGNINDVETAVLRYRLDIDDLGGGRIKAVTLQVINGEFTRLENARVYYTELHYNGL